MNTISKLLFCALFSTTALAAITNTDRAELGVVKNYIANGGIERGTAGFAAYFDGQTVTITIAAPGVFTTSSAHGLNVGDAIQLTTTGTLPAGLATAATYYVSVVPSSTTFQLSATQGGASITTTSTQSGVHTFRNFKTLRGSGGTASHLTISSSTSSPLQDSRSLLVSNSGSSAALGEGFSYAFTIPTSAKGTVQNISFDYQLVSGTFQVGGINSGAVTDSDLELFVFDVTNGTLIEPASRFLSCGSVVGTVCNYNSSFQTASNSTSYRLIWHAATTNTSIYSVKIDGINVSRVVRVTGVPSTDWQSYSPTLSGGGLGTPTGVNAQYRRVGGSLEGQIFLTSGTVAASLIAIPLPSGLSIDSNKITLANTTAAAGQKVGDFRCNGAAGAQGSIVTAIGTSAINVYFGGIYGQSTPLTPGTGSTDCASASAVTITFTVPITGWTSNVQMSDSSDTRVVAMSAQNSTTAATTAAPFVFTSVSLDTHGAYSSSTGKYTCPVSGYYQVSATLQISGNVPSLVIGAYVNGTLASPVYVSGGSGGGSFTVGSGSTVVACSAGQTIELRPSVSASAVNTNNMNSFSIVRAAGPSAIAASDPLYVSYYVSANFAASTTVPINFDTKDFDNCQCVTTSSTAWKFTAPSNGLYQIQGSGATGTSPQAMLYKNGTAYKNLGSFNGTPSGAFGGTVRLFAGDYIDVRPSASATITGGTLATAGTTNISITRIGL